MKYSKLLKDPRWISRRLEILEIDKHSCIDCGANESLEIHHTGYDGSSPWEYKDNQLITLCHNCHTQEHLNLKTYPWLLKDRSYMLMGLRSWDMEELFTIFAGTSSESIINEDVIKYFSSRLSTRNKARTGGWSATSTEGSKV